MEPLEAAILKKSCSFWSASCVMPKLQYLLGDITHNLKRNISIDISCNKECNIWKLDPKNEQLKNDFKVYKEILNNDKIRKETNWIEQ